MRKYLIIFILCLVFEGCQNDFQPKPHGFFRIDLPESSYQTFDSLLPFSFRYSNLASIIVDPMKANLPNFINVEYPRFNATIHLSYKEITTNFDTLTEDSRTMAMKHIQKADAIRQTLIDDRQNNIYGIIYDISGIGTASPCQFFVTDTTQHFLRGALYFNLVPNNDSLTPVIEYIRQDIDTLILSLEWK